VPLDHYVSQVHLKNFVSPVLVHLLYAIRKNDLKAFTPTAQSICRIEDGSTNSYLREERAVEEFLSGIEPRYNMALAKLEADSGRSRMCLRHRRLCCLRAHVLPAGMRIQSGPLQASSKRPGASSTRPEKYPPASELSSLLSRFS
jgi:hypothetical protein